ncbi:MAG: sugar ABC transporter substrate-binding protein, partial [Brachybacterium sp.]|nr:sugar ABC transporter substrate-binding protein [Brachybacterium sp.]
GGILEPFTDEDLAGVGLSPEDFNQAAWEAQQVDGQNIAIPLDTHPFVLFFNREVCEEADLVESDGRLTNLDGLDTFESALEAISGVTGGNAITLANVGEMSTPWRFFSTIYNQFDDATPFLSDGGAELTVNEDLFIEVMSMVQKWAENGWLNTGLDYAGSQTEMFRGNAGMYMQGEWEISTAQTIEGLDFGMQPIPTLFDKPAAQADSHTFVLPRKDRTPEERQQTMTFIKSMLDQSLDWAEGGHVPTYLPAFESEEYRQMEPQYDYASAAEVAAYNDPAWYGGSGSTFEATVGAQLALVQQLAISPQAALSAIRAQLETYLSTPSPL